MVEPEIFYPLCVALLAFAGVGLALAGMQPRRRR